MIHHPLPHIITIAVTVTITISPDSLTEPWQCSWCVWWMQEFSTRKMGKEEQSNQASRPWPRALVFSPLWLWHSLNRSKPCRTSYQQVGPKSWRRNQCGRASWWLTQHGDRSVDRRYWWRDCGHARGQPRSPSVSTLHIHKRRMKR